MLMEKQNTVENQLAHTLTQTEFDADYDKTAKKLLAQNRDFLDRVAQSLMEKETLLGRDLQELAL